MIEARDVSVAIGGKRIVTNVDFEARPGEIAAIVGPNGSGKTTFLRALSGDLGYSGEVTVNGRNLSAMKPLEAATLRAVLPQATTLSFPFTVREIVRLGLVGGRSGALSGEDQRLPERALARVDLDGFAGRFYQELSGGEQQRVQLARVLCQVWAPVLDGKPRYLFLDEPVSSLDIKHQLIIMDIARDFARRGGGVVAILHDLNLTAMYADRIFVMHRGRLAATGSPQQVLSDELIEKVFDCRLKVGVLPAANMPFVLPQSGLQMAVSCASGLRRPKHS
ncbi:heme ABC transporter ATP-binding protein [Mesorhizobium sp. M0601]|uniref:heme ABC transporter ATP-binding protein n=1 Tax=unclassified Mesorhizobium TaxID=325217 RepID=UPI0033384FD8